MLSNAPRWSNWSPILWLSLVCSNGSAAELTLPASCDPADPKSCVQPLLAGESAPFTGQLLTTRRAALMAVRADQADERAQLKLDEQAALWQIKLDLANRKAELDVRSYQTQIDLLEHQLEQQTTPWYAHPAFLVPVSAILGVVAGVACARLAIEALRSS